MLDSAMRERAEAIGLDVAELEQLCLGPDGVVAALRRLAMAEVEHELTPSPARAVADAGADPARRLGVGRSRWRQQTGPSIVLSIRFDPDEYDELCRTAEAKGIGTSVLARSYVRRGLGTTAVRLRD